MRISDWSSDVCSSDLFAEGAFSQAFVPILGQARSTRATEEVRVLLDRVALLLTAALALITVVGIIGAPWVVTAMASGLRAASRPAEFAAAIRSDERRVGKEGVGRCRFRWAQTSQKK